VSEGLSRISLPELRSLHAALDRGHLRCPPTQADLQASGFRAQAEPIARALAGLDRPAALAGVALVIQDREGRAAPDLDLVWTGPEPAGSHARDTAVVVRQLFEEARHSVLVGGYSFDHGKDILAPLHQAMAERGVKARLFLDIPGQAPTRAEADAYATAQIDHFLARNWDFGPPLPEIYYDPRTAEPGIFASLHAKCLVVDEQKTLITSANFTQRGQSRNLEVGVLIADPDFARRLVAHWNHLISIGLFQQYAG